MAKNKKFKNIFNRDKIEEFKRNAIEIILSPWRFFKFMCFSVGLVVSLITFAIGFYSFNFYNSLPQSKDLKFRAVKSKTIKRVREKFKDKRRRKNYSWKKEKYISRDILYTIVMSEDGTFFEHGGVNYNSLMDSLAHNIKKREYAVGASTITQQVVKNVFLTNEKSIFRKIKEILIARKLEKSLSKNEILEIYLNLAEFGPNLYGIHLASWYYFKKPASKINAGEAAFMALMLPSPRRLHHSIFENKYLPKKKRRKIIRILKDLRYKEFISPKQYSEYIKLNFLKGYQF